MKQMETLVYNTVAYLVYNTFEKKLNQHVVLTLYFVCLIDQTTQGNISHTIDFF